MQPHVNMGIRCRRGKKLDFWQNKRKKGEQKESQKQEAPEQQPTEVSGLFSRLLRGNPNAKDTKE